MAQPTAYVHSPLPATQLDYLNPNSLNNGFYELIQRCLQSETKFSFVHAGSTKNFNKTQLKSGFY